MQQSGNFGIFNVRFRVVQHAVDQLPFEKFGIVPTADFRLSKLVAHKQPLHCC
jgi:hypothetical protein